MQKPARTDFDRDATGPAPSGARLARVWDPFVRIFHWGLVTSFFVAWLTPGDLTLVHYWAGYAAGGLVVLRLLWGVVGTRYARFSQFVRHPRLVLSYLRDIATGHEARYIGHNPAGGAMVIALLLGMLFTALTGWMQTTTAYFGVAWVTELHDLAANGMLLLVLAHIGGVLLASRRHDENLIRAMLTGRKRPPAAGDIDD